MEKIIGIRREDKNKWERRVPLIPADVRFLRETHGITTIVQPSTIRVFADSAYAAAAARIEENLTEASVVFAVKEIPVQLLERGKTYVFFSHTIKGQPYNMEMLKRLMDLGCTLIDYERMTDSRSARTISFSVFAGRAGMIETLHAYGRKQALQGIENPFEKIRQAYQYASEDRARQEIRDIGRDIQKKGLPAAIHPLTIGLTGYGNVSSGAQDILDLLPVRTLAPEQLRGGLDPAGLDPRCLYKIVFEEKHMVRRREGDFELKDYYDHPENYESVFDSYLKDLKILVNCVYWTEDYPRLITRQGLVATASGANRPSLQVIGDISCDIEGSIEITHKATKPDNACYTYMVDTDAFSDGILGPGVTVMAIDNLPCEFPEEASTEFSSQLKKYAHDIASADFSVAFENLRLSSVIKKAVILYNGELTPDYQYMSAFIS